MLEKEITKAFVYSYQEQAESLFQNYLDHAEAYVNKTKVKDRNTKEPAPQETAQVMEEARKRGLLIGKGGLYGNVIRMSPPLNIAKADVDEAFKVLDESFATVAPGVAAAAR